MTAALNYRDPYSNDLDRDRRSLTDWNGAVLVESYPWWSAVDGQTEVIEMSIRSFVAAG